jgi:hypothetical protein
MVVMLYCGQVSALQLSSWYSLKLYSVDFQRRGSVGNRTKRIVRKKNN